jgi:hypothetical protein
MIGLAETAERYERRGYSPGYQRDRSEVRGAANSPPSLQEKTAGADGEERYTAPTLIFEADGRRLEAGGHQPLEA